MRAIGLLLSVLLSFCVVILHATTIHVPADEPTIQAGIDAAVDGDTVLVADGTYTGIGNRDIDFLGKAIVVKSENGPEVCIIDCEYLGRGFNFQNGEDSNSILQGFTIRNGSRGNGGGILCSESSPIIKGNTITGNTATAPSGGGGGIYCNASSPTIEGNFIEDNTAIGSSGRGGGIDCNSSSPVIEGNMIVGNTAHVRSGGINSANSSPIIAGNMIIGNTAEIGCCGGILCSGSSTAALITGNTITGNTAAGILYGGGGIGCDGRAVVTIENNSITGNSADWGAGIAIARSMATINNNTIAYNAADSSGGGIEVVADVHSASVDIANCTIISNEGGDAFGGGGFTCWDSSAVTITNTILWNNEGPTADEIYVGHWFPHPIASLTISYSDVEWGMDSVFVAEGCTLNWGEGMIDADPVFVLPDKQDYRLLWGSPCIDTGDPTLLDADGTRSDMGAHFFNQDDYLTLYVTPDKIWTRPGEQLGVTYTAINRWDSPEPCWLLSQVLLPGGSALNVLGPNQYTLPANHTAQVHINHPVPQVAPAGWYEYLSQISDTEPVETVYDTDGFNFLVIE